MKKQSFKSRNFKGGAYSAVLSIFVIVIIVVINLLFSSLPGSVKKFDFSEQKLFSISDQTKKVLKSLDAEVTVYLIAQSGKESTILSELLDKYDSMSKNLSVVKKDPAVYPAFVGQYTDQTLADNSVIVESNKRSRVIAYESIFTQNTDASTEFNGEDLVTSAIDYVTSETLAKMYVISGHGESAMDSSFQNEVERENIELTGLTLATAEAIPEDAVCLFMQAPTGDINEKEAAILAEYLKKGGSLFYTSFYQKSETPNLDKLLADYGIQVEAGYVCEGSSNYYIQYKNFIVANLGNHTITEPLVNNSRVVLIPFAQNIKKLGNAPNTVEVTSLLKTTSSAYMKALDSKNSKELSLEKAEGDKTGIMCLAAAVSEKTENGTTKILVLTSPYVFGADINKMVSGGNYDFALNAVSYLCEHDSMISIRGKATASESLVTTSGVAIAWMTGLMIFLPVASIAAGLIIWQRRRKR